MAPQSTQSQWGTLKMGTSRQSKPKATKRLPGERPCLQWELWNSGLGQVYQGQPVPSPSCGLGWGSGLNLRKLCVWERTQDPGLCAPGVSDRRPSTPAAGSCLSLLTGAFWTEPGEARSQNLLKGGGASNCPMAEVRIDCVWEEGVPDARVATAIQKGCKPSR